MIVLGISCYYHDAAAALVIDGKTVAAVEEERFTRKKHDNRFPILAVRSCLEQARISVEDIDIVCFYEKPLLKLERVLQTARTYDSKSSEYLTEQFSHYIHERLFIENVLQKQIGYTGKVLFIEHHAAHAASAFYISPFQEAGIMTIDGVGEWASTCQYIGNGNRIEKIREIRYPHSLGLLYSTFTAFLGFKVNNDEYKVMGLASYGEPKYTDKIYRLIKLNSDASFRLNLDYFSFMHSQTRMYNDNFIELFGEPRISDSAISQYHMDLAASVQAVLEEILVALGCDFHKLLNGIDNICLAGGVSLNCVANRRFIDETPFKQICIQPASGDGGAAVGAALEAYYRTTNNERKIERNQTYLGPEFSREEIKSVLDANNADYIELSDDELFEKVAGLINDNFIIGWYQGRMEYGPRALGNRSIIANACNPDMKDILNSRVKFREDFRPFAPAVIEENTKDYFDISFESPFMLFTAPVQQGCGTKIPSVTHTDNTARLQTVSKQDNPRFHRLINTFGEKTGVPVIINTSFNVRGEPIVCSPEDAYRCFMKTDIDYLVMDNFLIDKEL